MIVDAFLIAFLAAAPAAAKDLCAGPFDLEAAIAAVPAGGHAETLVQDIEWRQTCLALAAGDREICRGIKALPPAGTEVGDWGWWDGPDKNCEVFYSKLTVIQSFMLGRKDAGKTCLSELGATKPTWGHKGNREMKRFPAVCRALARKSDCAAIDDAGARKECESWKLLLDGREDCSQWRDNVMKADACREVKVFYNAAKEKDAEKCGGSALCLVLMGRGESACEPLATRVRDVLCRK